jgi:hypothetical protein
VLGTCEGLYFGYAQSHRAFVFCQDIIAWQYDGCSLNGHNADKATNCLGVYQNWLGYWLAQAGAQPGLPCA